MKMTKNMGAADRIIRVIIAAIIAILYFYTHAIYGTLGVILLIIAGIFLLTSIIGFCPLYTLFGIKTTCEKKK